nr:hypothetical protein [Tanacetum cinerariifolium]
MPPKYDLSFVGLDDSIYTFKISEIVTSVTEDEKDAPKTSTNCVDKTKEDRFSAPLIQDWDFDSDNDSEGYHVVPPPLTGNFMPPKYDLSFVGLDDSIYTFKISEIVTSVTEDEKDAPETSTNCVDKTKEDRFIAPLIQDWDSDSDNDSVFSHKLILARIDFMKAGESVKHGHPHQTLKNKGIVDSGCSRHMTGNKAYLADYQEINDGGFVAFGSSKGNQTDKNAGPQDTNGNAGTQDNVDAGKEVSDQHYIMLPLWSSISSAFKRSDEKAEDDKPKDDTEKEASDAADAFKKESEQGCMDQKGITKAGSTNPDNTVSNPVNAASTSRTFSAGGPSSHPDAFIPAPLFWNTATYKTVNSVKQIHTIVDGKAVVISESSVRSVLLFNNEDGIACLTNAEIFKNLALMGYEQISTELTFQKGSFSPQFSYEPQTKAHIEQILPSLSTYQRKHRKTHKHRRAKKVTKLPQTSVPLDLENDEAIHKEGGNSVERAITTDASLVAALDSDNITKTQSTAMSNDPISQEIGSGDRPRRQETTLGGADAQTRVLALEVAQTTQDKVITRLKLRVRRLEKKRKGRNDDKIEELNLTDEADTKVIIEYKGSGEKGDRPRCQETTLGDIDAQIRLKLRVMRLEKKRKAKTSQPMKRRLFKGRVETFTDKSLDVDASKQGRNDDKIKELNLTDGADTEVLVEDKGSGEKGGSTADQTLIKLRSEKAKEKEVAFRDVKEPPRLTRSTTTIQPLPTIDPKDKELAQRIYEKELAELDRAQKERQKQEEATIDALTEEFDEIQARIDADHELAVRMTHEEKEKYTVEEMKRLLAEYFKRRKKQLAVERAEAIRNKPPTRTQVRNMVITYLKHMGKYTHQQLKHKTFEEPQKLYQKEQKWIDDFAPMDSEKEQKKSVA